MIFYKDILLNDWICIVEEEWICYLVGGLRDEMLKGSIIGYGL